MTLKLFCAKCVFVVNSPKFAPTKVSLYMVHIFILYFIHVCSACLTESEFSNLCNTSVKVQSAQCKVANVIIYITSRLFQHCRINCYFSEKAASDIEDHIFTLHFYKYIAKIWKSSEFHEDPCAGFVF